jgi:hypothetical protein
MGKMSDKEEKEDAKDEKVGIEKYLSSQKSSMVCECKKKSNSDNPVKEAEKDIGTEIDSIIKLEDDYVNDSNSIDNHSSTSSLSTSNFYPLQFGSSKFHFILNYLSV